MAELALKLSIDCDPHNYESFNNLGILCLRNNNVDQATYYLGIANREGEMNFEAYYN